MNNKSKREKERNKDKARMRRRDRKERGRRNNFSCRLHLQLLPTLLNSQLSRFRICQARPHNHISQFFAINIIIYTSYWCYFSASSLIDILAPRIPLFVGLISILPAASFWPPLLFPPHISYLLMLASLGLSIWTSFLYFTHLVNNFKYLCADPLHLLLVYNPECFQNL